MTPPFCHLTTAERPSVPQSSITAAPTGRFAGQSSFAPPGDIHRIRNTGTRTAISLHIYGTDITRIGSSARRYYN